MHHCRGRKYKQFFVKYYFFFSNLFFVVVIIKNGENVGTMNFQELLNTGFDDNKTKQLMQLRSRQLNAQDGTKC